ncbi:MAG: phosphate/phosphite/phosphonate ABC transporter substrate-binding protein [Thiobacillus sp.]
MRPQKYRWCQGIVWITLLVLFGLSPLARAGKPAPFVFGVFPNLGTQQILMTYRPLADVLEKRFHRQVLIFTAPDFKTFVTRTHRGEYDLVLTAPHMAWLARQEAGYRPLLQFDQPVRGLLVVNKASALNTLQDLDNSKIAIGDPLAVTVLAMQDLLAASGLKSGQQFRLYEAGTQSNAAMQVVSRRSDAAIVGRQPLNALPEDMRQQLRVIAETRALSSQMFLTHPRVNERDAASIQEALLAFERLSAGQTFMTKSGFGKLVPVRDGEFQVFRPYALEVQRLMRDVR